MARGKVKRNIYYYDIIAYTKDENENLVRCHDQQRILLNVFEHISKLNDELIAAKNDVERNKILRQLECTTLYGDKLYVLVDNIDYETGYVKFRIVLCRVDALPYIEKDGYLINITSFVDGKFNIAEVTHCVLFSKENIMGAEFNFNGARPSAISQYITEVYEKITHLACMGKMRNDTFERIVDDDGFSLFELSVRNTEHMREILRDKMGLLGAFFNEIKDMDTYEICIRRRKGKNKKGFDTPFGIQEMKEFVNDNREDIRKFRVSQGCYKDSIDLLSDKMVCTVEFVLTEDKCINSNEVFAIIVNYFDIKIKGDS